MTLKLLWLRYAIIRIILFLLKITVYFRHRRHDTVRINILRYHIFLRAPFPLYYSCAV